MLGDVESKEDERDRMNGWRFSSKEGRHFALFLSNEKEFPSDSTKRYRAGVRRPHKQ